MYGYSDEGNRTELVTRSMNARFNEFDLRSTNVYESAAW